MRAPHWTTRHPEKTKRLVVRIVDALREVGVLLIAFAPLDTALSGGGVRESARPMSLFLGAGLLIFAVSLMWEWRLDDVQ